ncbi:hypothetical protein KOW79_011895 [Hemibagrus wyckioides]|uniref:Uncharacterized protein n=1 Tax=Hemibagrus wyckioides TaxID=337641 RepID=A0A9D3NL52_9TELE|nr:hypothetical protein KOW79_011895 [Hemibagrus wyckioides]
MAPLWLPSVPKKALPSRPPHRLGRALVLTALEVPPVQKSNRAAQPRQILQARREAEASPRTPGSSPGPPGPEIWARKSAHSRPRNFRPRTLTRPRFHRLVEEAQTNPTSPGPTL